MPRPALDIGAADEVHGEIGRRLHYGRSATTCSSARTERQHYRRLRQRLDLGGTATNGILVTTAHLREPQQRLLRPSRSTASPRFRRPSSTPIVSDSSGSTIAITNDDGRLSTGRPHAGTASTRQRGALHTMPRALFATTSSTAAWARQHPRARRRRDFGSRGAGSSYVNNYNQARVKIAGPDRSDYSHPVNPGNVLGYSPTTTKFALYDANDRCANLLTPAGALSKTGSGLEWALNFDENEDRSTPWRWARPIRRYDGRPMTTSSGDLGHDWLVGGTGRDSSGAAGATTSSTPTTSSPRRRPEQDA